MQLSDTQSVELQEMFEEFLNKYYHEDLLEFLEGFPSEHRCFTVSWYDLFQYNASLADDLLANFEQVKGPLEAAFYNYDIPIEADLSNGEIRVGDVEPERTYDVGEYKPDKIGTLVGINGQVTQMSATKPKVDEGVFICQRCGTPTTIPQPDHKIEEPRECQGCEREGPFKLDADQSRFKEFQVARVKLPPEKSNGGDTHIDIHLDSDLANGPLNGNERINAYGELTINPEGNDNGTFDYYLDTEAIEVVEGGYDDIDIDEHIDEIMAIADSEAPVDQLVDSFAPGIQFDEDLRRITTALVLQMVGAGRKTPASGASYRGDSHMLLLGDPGTAKSALLEEAAELAPRAKRASGKGLSKAGMTAAAVRDDFGPDEWTLKAGILVLANNGVACIDEIDKVPDNAVSAAHSALETQTVSVFKAGIDAELPARTTLLAAGNPKHGRFDQYKPVSEQIDLEPSLMSRFDLMYMVQDEIEEERDRGIAEHVVEGWDQSARMEYNDEEIANGRTEREIDEDVFQAYIAYARERVFPTFKDESVKQRIIDQYVEIRQEGDGDDSPVPITARKLEAFLRLTEASARARLSDDITVEDGERAIALVRRSLEDVGIDPETGEYDADIVEAGTSKSQRDRIKTVKELIDDISGKYESNSAPEGEVLNRADDIDMDTGKVKNEIEKLKQKGEVYEPEEGHYQTA